MKNIGIWIDKEKAYIINDEAVDKVLSNIENYHVHGGSGTRFKGGPQDVVQDSKYLEREKHQFKTYFKEVISNIKDADNIVIFGPAETGKKLNKELIANYNTISKKVKDVLKADSMTDNETRALIRDYFEKFQKDTV